MKEKEKLIIETAMKLFATKGFNSTSIQEIASECGISKGAFYLYFKSKEALLLAILKYYSNRIFAKMKAIDEKGLEPREKFLQQIECQFKEIQKHKEFIIMQARENALPFNEEIEFFIQSMRVENHQFYRRSLFAIYGDKIKPFFWDLNLMMQGFIHSYLELSMIDKLQIDYKKLALFMLNRADDLVEGLLKSKEESVLSAEEMDNLLQSNLIKNVTKEAILRKIDLLTKETFDDSVLISLDVIKDEVEASETRVPVIKGMLANLEGNRSFKEFISMIKSYYKLK